ncbi:MAG: transposase [Spirulina sp. SIO3F2]|nr:transposase [Spirulina sp. SIO3F2]
MNARATDAAIVQQRLAQGYPPHRPPHPIRDQSFYLLTAACYEHQCHLYSDARRQQLLSLLFERFVDVGIELRGWVILPNHYHLLIYLGKVRSEDFSPRYQPFEEISKVLKRVHGTTSRQWNVADQTVGRTVWFAYSDRAIRSERHYYTTLNYIHYNPVKHGWANSPYDWAYSSVHWYLEEEGRAWLRDSWVRYPVKEYGKDWDDFRGLKSLHSGE